MEHKAPEPRGSTGPAMPVPRAVIGIIFLLTVVLAVIFLVAAQVVQTP